ncbi:MAG: HepT-like ribonuclease domain-containing protein [Methanolinea sp.]
MTKLIHAYFDVHVERLWYTVVDDLPGLEQALRAILIEMD